MKEHRCIYFGWAEFDAFITSVVDKNNMGMGITNVKRIHIEDGNSYSWKVVTKDDYDYIKFDDYKLFPFISKELGVKVKSSHVDEDGVWLVLE